MTATGSRHYRGRFAPSPTGPLHFGSCVAAIASFLDARHHGGLWFVRIDDIDPPREQPGAAASILRTLDMLGLEWDGEVRYQHTRSAAYDAALAGLAARGQTFACACTRRDLQGGVYRGTCRNGIPPGKRARSVRLRVAHERIGFRDRVQGDYHQDLASEVGDFVLRRADGLYAYHLANVVDDADLGITDVVRGADLIDSAPRQIALQHALDLPTPRYAHMPAVLDRNGRKLSKQTQAAAVAPARARALWCDTLRFLNQSPPPDLHDGTLAEIIACAIANWRLGAVDPRSRPAGTAGGTLEAAR